MNRRLFWRGIVVVAMLLAVIVVGAYAVSAYDTHQQYEAALAQATAMARATQTADAHATAEAQAATRAEATVAANYTAIANATAIAQATAAARPTTCLVGVSGHDATLIVNGPGAQVVCDRLTGSNAGGYVATQGSYNTASDTWHVDEGWEYVYLSYVCSYADGPLAYSVYDGGAQVYGGEMCKHLAADAHTTPIPDVPATAIAQSTAHAQATADTQVAYATATAQAAPLYMHICTESDYDALAMNCKADNRRIGAHDATIANVAVGGGSTAWGSGVTGIDVEQMQADGSYKRIVPHDNTHETDVNKSFWILGNVLPDSDSGDAVPGQYRLTVTINKHALPPYNLVVIPQQN